MLVLGRRRVVVVATPATRSTTPCFIVVVLLLSVVSIAALVSVIRRRFATDASERLSAVWPRRRAFFIAFRPVYNGDMGVYRWRLRFAADADMSLAQLSSTGEAADWQTTPHDYPRFLGNGYWAEVKGVELETDWQSHPPQELWRHEIGAGWSAFAIAGDYAVTQEQRGENELVTCYRVQTGEPVWTHADATRFDPADAIGGLGDVGPRATPTIQGDRIFTQGGTGIVNCLDARTGRVIWSHDTPAEFGATVTVWGKSGSPLVVDDMVLISVGAPSGGSGARRPHQRPGSPHNQNLQLIARRLRHENRRRPLVRRLAPSQLRLAGRRHARRRAANHRRQRKLGHRPPRERRQNTLGTPLVE